LALPQKYIFLAKHRPALAETEGRGRTSCFTCQSLRCFSGQVVIFGYRANAGIIHMDEKRGKFQRTRPIQARPLPLDQAWEPHYALSARDALEAAALRDFDPANARFGSSTAETGEATCLCTSASLRKRTISRTSRQVRFVPRADLLRLIVLLCAWQDCNFARCWRLSENAA
jgi:hypothetical protein